MSLHVFVTSQIIVITGISKTYFLVPTCTLSNFFTQVQLLHAYEHLKCLLIPIRLNSVS